MHYYKRELSPIKDNQAKNNIEYIISPYEANLK